MMNFIAVVVTLDMGYLGCSFFPDTNFANVFPIVTMGFFILKKIDMLTQKKEDKGGNI